MESNPINWWNWNEVKLYQLMEVEWTQTLSAAWRGMKSKSVSWWKWNEVKPHQLMEQVPPLCVFHLNVGLQITTLLEWKGVHKAINQANRDNFTIYSSLSLQLSKFPIIPLSLNHSASLLSWYVSLSEIGYFFLTVTPQPCEDWANHFSQ